MAASTWRHASSTQGAPQKIPSVAADHDGFGLDVRGDQLGIDVAAADVLAQRRRHILFNSRRIEFDGLPLRSHIASIWLR